MECPISTASQIYKSGIGKIPIIIMDYYASNSGYGAATVMFARAFQWIMMNKQGAIDLGISGVKV